MPRTAAASPEDIFGFGTRSSALAATGAASAEGYEAVYGNPALLSLTRERWLSLGFLGASFDLHAGARALSYEALRGSVLGATLPIPLGGLLRDRVTLGLGLFTPFDLIVRARILHPETPQFLLADRSQSVAAQVGLGLDLGQGLRVGGGFASLAALTGSVLVATDASGRVGTVVEDTLVASYAPIVGASFDLSDAYRLGLTFRGELVGRFDVVIDVRDLGEIVVPQLHIAGVAQHDPWQLALELARVAGPWKLALGATYRHASAYPGPVEATLRCPLFDPATGLPFTDACTAQAAPGPGYSDTVTPRLGVERSFLPARGVTMHLRGGSFFEPSPAPEQTGASNLYDNARLALTLGYGVELGPPWPRLRLDVFSQLHVLLPRTHEKRAPSGGPRVEVETDGAVLAAGSTLGLGF